MAKEYIIDSDENSDYMYNIVKSIITEVGPRPACSENEKKASNWSQKELEKYCDDVDWEGFYCCPSDGPAGPAWVRFDTALLAISLLLFLLTNLNLITKIIFSIIPMCLMILCILIFYKSFLRYEETMAPICKLKPSQNVIGTIKPDGEIKKRVIFSGHIDSTIWRPVEYMGHAYMLILLNGMFSQFPLLIVFSLQLIYALIGFELIIITFIINIIIFIVPGFFCALYLTGSRKNWFSGYLEKMPIKSVLWVLLFSSVPYLIDIILLLHGFELILTNSAIIIVLTNLHFYFGAFFMINRKGGPGATDNLTSVAICHGITKVLHDWKKLGHPDFPKNTEVKILICGCEECGLRGSTEFARRHSRTYNKIYTKCINFEGIENSEYLKFYTREDQTGSDMDPEIVSDLVQIAEELNIGYRLLSMPAMSGATDAAGLVRGGLKTACIEGMHNQDILNYYHTSRDNLDMLNEERRPCNDHGTNWKNRNIRCAMENVLKICIEYVKLVDKKEL